jgi:thiamine pyrophosphokinase
MARLIIFANGLVPEIENARQLIKPGDVLYAADGGTHHALALGLLPSVIIGDLDSLGPEDRARVEAGGVDIRQYPRDNIRFDDGVEEVFFTRNHCEILGRTADIVSLVPWGGKVTGILTQGLRWPLRNETLFPQRTRGISNEMSSENAAISLRSGLLLVIHQHHV